MQQHSFHVFKCAYPEYPERLGQPVPCIDEDRIKNHFAEADDQDEKYLPPN